MKSRRADITIIRVISMFMILLCHTAKYFTFIPGSQMLNQLLNVGVEIFLAMSGYLYAKKTIKNYKSFMIGRVKRIHIPVLIVVIIYLTVSLAVFHTTPGWFSNLIYLLNLQGLIFINRKYFSLIITEISVFGPLWYTTIIMLCYMLIPVFQKVRDSVKPEEKARFYRNLLIALYAISFVLELTTTTALFYVVVFWTGYILADINYDQQPYSVKKIFEYIILIIAMLVFRVVIKTAFGESALYAALVSMEHTVLGLSIMLLLLELGKKLPALYQNIANCKPIIWLDDMSFYIYLVHGVFCMGHTSFYRYLPVLPATVLFVFATLITAKIVSILTNLINTKLSFFS